MRELLAEVRAWQAAGVAVGRAVVVRTFGSAPRPAGASLVATADGRIAGSVSGGCVEGAVVAEIARARAAGLSRVLRYGITDEQAWDVGLACGGTIDVLVEPLVRPEIAEAAAGRGGSAVVIPLPSDAPRDEPGPRAPGAGEPPSPALVVDADGTLRGSTGAPGADAAIVAAARAALDRGGATVVEAVGRQWLVEGFAPPPRLVIVGAVQVAIPLARIAREIGYATVVVDGRAAFATRERFPDVDALVVGWLDEVADEIGLGPSDAVAVLAHDAKLDEPAIIEALRRGCRYVGAVGSRRTQADRRARLRTAGVGEPDLVRLRGPIGLDLGGRSPAETALAIIAEVVAERSGGSGAPLATLAGR
ncbi:MAG: XdhC family protein [Chloroflexi bacterium]|nr:XdhC family protein [Chloroflexota bacterium]